MNGTIAVIPPLLLIEDEPSVLQFIRTALERNGYSCRTANSAIEGIDVLRSGSFIGVISDMRMPGGAGGAEVYAWLTINRPELKNKILFITGDVVNEETLKALNDTGVPYIEKPFRMSELMAVVEKLFGWAR